MMTSDRIDNIIIYLYIYIVYVYVRYEIVFNTIYVMYINYKLNFRYQIMCFTYWNNKWYPDNNPANW